MSTTRTGSAPREMEDAVRDLTDIVEDGIELAFRLLGSVAKGPVIVVERMREQAPGGLFKRAGCGCDIPPPCWMPASLGELTDHACAGGTAIVRFRVTNCGAEQRQVRLEAVSPGHAVQVTGSPKNLGPMERAVLSASIAIPADADDESRYQILLWVRGCRDHFLRWTVKVGRRGAECCHELDVEDCPDLIHHWYDHFYCEHKCHGG
ncbi:MAG: hypothetical protein JF888_09465 [Candidatus Dormibacteraeota bacterium]|uniref:Uncharacterized protein n=1 Tax=Candidatus Dormiibacter inghamiae TaxID=3127013 RepID=A0A934KBF3_9BACT|nr:hypothetical protein [Candidatus Dormibacteraeota bacterium]MBJ7606782.1 hypothetical protein [Candidatus Dormibacteraeota bacterium]